jgi:hypothetical protein
VKKKNIKTIPKSGSRHNRNFEQNKSRTRTKGEKSRVKERNSLQRGLDLRNVNREREGEVVVVVLDYVSWVFIVSSNGPEERRNLARFCVFRMLQTLSLLSNPSLMGTQDCNLKDIIFYEILL